MKIITRQSRANEAAKLYRKNYYNTPYWDHDDIANKSRKLKALGKTPSPNDVDNIVGHDGWTRIDCHECGKRCQSVVIEVGDCADFDKNKSHLCLDCIDKLTTLAREAKTAVSKVKAEDIES